MYSNARWPEGLSFQICIPFQGALGIEECNFIFNCIHHCCSSLFSQQRHLFEYSVTLLAGGKYSPNLFKKEDRHKVNSTGLAKMLIECMKQMARKEKLEISSLCVKR